MDHVLLTCSKHTRSLAWEGELFQHLLVLSGITTLSAIRNPPIVPNGFIYLIIYMNSCMNHEPVYSVFLFEAAYVGCMCELFSCNLLPILQFGRMTGIFYVLRRPVAQGWNGYRSKSQHRKLTWSREWLPPRLLLGIEPATFRS